MAELGDHLKNLCAKPNNARTNDPKVMQSEGPGLERGTDPEGPGATQPGGNEGDSLC